MLIRCWGARGSIAVDGEQYSKYGGNTTCMEIRSGDDVFIIDAGTGIRALGNHLRKNNDSKYHLFFTHVHWDHIIGFPFFKPLYSKNTKLVIYGCSFTGNSFQDVIAKTMVAPYFPINIDGLSTSISYESPCMQPFKFGSLTVTSIPLSHPNQGLGYCFNENGKRFVFLTDNELQYPHPGRASYEEYLEFCKGADLLIHDAEYLPEEYPSRRNWGHSSVTDALELAIKAGVKRFGLFHLNQERSDNDVDEMVDMCQKNIKKQKLSLECYAIGTGFEITL